MGEKIINGLMILLGAFVASWSAVFISAKGTYVVVITMTMIYMASSLLFYFSYLRGGSGKKDI
ncbi:MAG: hypothetical protein PHE76_01995 [Candidatus Pacebacteria bacterium]|jgi:hypothetical protein|nr:hypothetical protein [Candidatus Paceibacterota bacterium]